MFLCKSVLAQELNCEPAYDFYWYIVGLGKASQGISTALSVEKTSKRGGKIVNLAAEQGILLVYLHWE